MEEHTQKHIGLLVTALVFLSFVTVKASASYSVRVDGINTNAFPAVMLNLEVSGDTDGVFARHLSILENGTQQHGPMVWLPPAIPNKKIDLFVLLDRSGNAEKYRQVIRGKLEALMTYFEEEGVDAKIYLTGFGNNDAGSISSPDTFADDAALRSSFDSLNFDSGISGKAHGLKRISSTDEITFRSGAEKILLVLNSTPFYDHGQGDEETTYTVDDAVGILSRKGFLTFVIGYPFKNLYSFSNENEEKPSLSSSMPGGYLGSFSADLTLLHDLLQSRDSYHFTLYYTSNLMPAEASGANVNLYISESSAGSFNYPTISPASPTISHLTTTSVMSGDALPIQLEVNPAGKMISEVELAYVDKNESIQTTLLKKNAASSTLEAQIFEGEIPAGDYPEGSDSISYAATVYTPYDKVGGDEPISVDVDLFDEGIRLTPTLFPDSNEVSWTWSGTTVDMGTEYEIWAGESRIEGYDAKTKARHYEIPITECNRYQIVKVRVLLRDGVDHPRAGDWSLFSRPGEYYYADPAVPQGSFTESYGIGKMVECLHETAYETPAAFIASQSGYKSSSKLYLNRMLYYLTAVLGQSDLKDLRPDRYSLLYLFMDYLGQDDYDTYGMDEELTPVSLLYKMITQANQTANLDTLYSDSMDELSVRLRGNTSI